MANPRLFAEYVLNDAPAPDEVGALLDALRRLLREEMRPQIAGNLAPSAWVYAGRSWSEEETFNDLLNDCYRVVFTGNRLLKFREYARNQASIDAAVRIAVRHFLCDLGRKRDPA